MESRRPSMMFAGVGSEQAFNLFTTHSLVLCSNLKEMINILKKNEFWGKINSIQIKKIKRKMWSITRSCLDWTENCLCAACLQKWTSHLLEYHLGRWRCPGHEQWNIACHFLPGKLSSTIISLLHTPITNNWFKNDFTGHAFPSFVA